MMNDDNAQLPTVVRLRCRCDDRPQGLKLMLRDAGHVVPHERLELRPKVRCHSNVAAGKGVRDGVPSAGARGELM